MKAYSNQAEEMFFEEIDPLLEELELRESRRNHIDAASNIAEIRERFAKVVDQVEDKPR